MKLTIGHLYPDLLNLYGDRGNIQWGFPPCFILNYVIQYKSYLTFYTLCIYTVI